MNTYPIPAFRVTLDGIDLTAKIKPRLVSMTLTENRSNESDQLDITLDDADGKLAIPSKGARITLQIGFVHSGLVDKGNFTVDEIEHNGSPDVLVLRARTASLIDNFRQLEERSYHNTTLEAVIKQIASRHGLKAAVSPSIAKKAISHIDQTSESDASFLRRLGKQYDAVSTIKSETLVFAPAGRGKTVGGKNLPVIQIVRQLGDRHRYHSAERDSYSGVRAFWHDPKRAKRRSVVAGVPGNSKRLRRTFANEKDALAAATAEWTRIQRGVFAFEMDLAIGAPTAFPESPVKVTGFKKQIDETDWIAVRTVHTIGQNGFTTRIELETKLDEAAAEIEYGKDPEEGITGVSAEWKDRNSKKTGTETAGSTGNVKKLAKTYTSKARAARGAKLEWEKIKERREMVKENATEDSA